MNKQCINIITVGTMYHIKNFGDRDLSMKSTISELAPNESIQYGMDLKTAAPPKVVEEQK